MVSAVLFRRRTARDVAIRPPTFVFNQIINGERIFHQRPIRLCYKGKEQKRFYEAYVFFQVNILLGKRKRHLDGNAARQTIKMADISSK